MGKLLTHTLCELSHLLDLSKTGSRAACWAAEYLETDGPAKKAVTKSRETSRSLRCAIARLVKMLDEHDTEVEKAFQSMRQSKKGWD